MARQAILTKYLPLTNHRPGRIKCVAEAGTLIVSWDHALDDETNHTDAAQAFADKFEWVGKLRAGGMPSSTPWAFCFVLSAK